MTGILVFYWTRVTNDDKTEYLCVYIYMKIHSLLSDSGLAERQPAPWSGSS